jgi:transposase
MRQTLDGQVRFLYRKNQMYTKRWIYFLALDIFLGRYGIPEALASDNAKAYIHDELKKKAKEAGVFYKLTDPYSPWQNRAEGEIRKIKWPSGCWMVRSRSLRQL